jgi:hypothetical protein
MSAGKGDRPRKVVKKKYDENYDKIVWKKDKKENDKKIKNRIRYSY